MFYKVLDEFIFEKIDGVYVSIYMIHICIRLYKSLSLNIYFR